MFSFSFNSPFLKDKRMAYSIKLLKNAEKRLKTPYQNFDHWPHINFIEAEKGQYK